MSQAKQWETRKWLKLASQSSVAHFIGASWKMSPADCVSKKLQIHPKIQCCC